MDGTLAAIFAIASLTDMVLYDCPTGCLAPLDATARLTISAATIQYQDRAIGSEVALGYDFGRRLGPFQPTVALAITQDRDTWIGAGAKWTTQDLWPGRLFVEASFMPGLHLRADGPDLGGALHFRSGLGVGYAFDNGATLTAIFDHRSNGDRLALNPGMESLSIRYAIALD